MLGKKFSLRAWLEDLRTGLRAVPAPQAEAEDKPTILTSTGE